MNGDETVKVALSGKKIRHPSEPYKWISHKDGVFRDQDGKKLGSLPKNFLTKGGWEIVNA